jgi:hypothetical protein
LESQLELEQPDKASKAGESNSKVTAPLFLGDIARSVKPSSLKIETHSRQNRKYQQ